MHRFECFGYYLKEFRKNLTSKAARSRLIKEPMNKSYGDPWLPARFGIKARLRRHAVACQEVAMPSPNCAGSPAGRTLKHASAALQPSLRAKAITFGLRLASTCFRARTTGVPAQSGLSVATSWQATACLRSRALIPNRAGIQGTP